jgi:uncharacterized membrane protein YfcA
MIDTTTIVIVAGTFLIAGTVKGVIGLGIGMVSLALLTVAIRLPEAMSLLLVPAFVTNFWQAIVGGNGKVILLRIWAFLVAATATVWIGAAALTRVDLGLLSALLGLLLVFYSSINLSGYRLTLTPRQEIWLGPLAGLVNGLFAGMTGSFVVPGVMFLQAIGLPRDMLIQAMGILFTVSTAALALALQNNNFLTVELSVLSTAALLPAVVGMIIGQRIRKKMSEQTFLRVFFISLFSLGAYIITDGLNSLS